MQNCTCIMHLFWELFPNYLPKTPYFGHETPDPVPGIVYCEESFEVEIRWLFRNRVQA